MYDKLTKMLKEQKNGDPVNPFEFKRKPRDAAVLILFHKNGGEDSVVLTKRSEEVAHHKGQISFPGGVYDFQDKTLWDTALRETKEEIGVDPASISFVGELGKNYSPYGFRVTPFVARSVAPLSFSPSPIEIAEIINVPLSHLLNSENLQFVTRVLNGKEFHDPVFTYHDHKIWGVTGRILVELLEFCRLAI